MASVTSASPQPLLAERRKTIRDSLIVSIGGQLERAIGTVAALVLRWGLDPAHLGVYTGLRLYLDNTNRSSLGIGLGAVQEIPILRAQGRFSEAQRVADIAHTTNTVTCLIYAVLLVAWAALRFPLVASDPLAAEWTWGLVAVAALALLKRYESFLIAVLRAHQEFVVTTELDILEASASALVYAAGLWLAGFWGLLGSVGVLLGMKIAYLHARSSLRFRWAWERPTASRLMWTGLPILANTAIYGAVLNIDRVLILWRLPDGERALGLYSIAIMGTSWSLDLAGRIVLVLYTAFQTTLGRTRDPDEVARQAMNATEAQAPILLAGSAAAYLVGPVFLGALMPKYAAGLPALRPLLPGMILLGLAWPARQMLIAIGRPYRLVLATLAGLMLTAIAGGVGADRAGIVGVAWGMSIGYAAIFLIASATAFTPAVGWRAWGGHQARLVRMILTFGGAALIACHVPLAGLARWPDFTARCAMLSACGLPLLWRWGMQHGWGGIFRPSK